ncbi:TonB family protein [Porphyrobacter algicida]|uniref:TonB family protein n=1 Tax=Qipengyuania algicida TaxID=1836209 RepID=A0A845AG70_9SPHN|nr:TonB family protein [Qipengyuania algicida]
MAKDESSGPTAIDPGSWVPSDDYPPAALHMNAEGAVGVRIKVGEDGVPTYCAVHRSSGNADLDKAACDAVMLRAKFRPATDESGNPVQSVYSTRIVWKLEGAQTPPPETAVRVTAIIEMDGTVTHCEVDATGTLEGENDDICAKKPHYRPFVGKDGEPVRKRITLTTSVHYEDVPDAAE